MKDLPTHNKITRRILFIAAAVAGALIAGYAVTAEDEDATQASSEVFQPTEEISEDYAVAFPVDI